jgi:hypothetical protein
VKVILQSLCLAAKIELMHKKFFQQRPLLTLPQIIALFLVGGSLFVALDLNRRAQASELVGIGQEALEVEVAIEQTRQIELQATLEYVQSDAYIAAYARDEGGYLLPGEKRIVPLTIDATPMPTAVPQPTPDPATEARPWQAWWRLLTDAPYPAE